MPPLMTLVLCVSTSLLLLLILYRLRSRTHRESAAIAAAGLLLYVALIHWAFDFPDFPDAGMAKGTSGTESGALVLALFLFMSLGMSAEYLYYYLDAKPGVVRFNWRTFLKPFLVSPLIFMPLGASLQNSNVDLSHFYVPLLMLYLVAFENGFLWRGYFARKLAPPGNRNNKK